METKNLFKKIFEYGKRKVNKLGIKTEEDVNKIVQEFRHSKQASNK